jgi:hypothetical protein
MTSLSGYINGERGTAPTHMQPGYRRKLRPPPASGHFTQEKPNTGGWLSLEAGQNSTENFTSTGIRSPDSPASGYSKYAITATLILILSSYFSDH